MFFIFSSIIQLTVVNYLHKSRNIILQNNKQQRHQLNINAFNQNSNHIQFPCNEVNKEYPLISIVPWHQKDNNYQLNHEILTDASITDPPDRAFQVDLAFRYIYPICFVIFLIVFWPLLLTRSMLK